MYKLSYYHVVTDVINEPPARPKHILYSTRTGRAVIIAGDILRQIQAGDFSQASDKLLSTLFELEILVPAHENEFESIIGENYASVADPNVASFTLQPGANCQLGCHYCGQKHTKNYMDETIYEKMLTRMDGILAKHSYEHLAITWYGGEPLMAWKQIRDLSPRLIAMARERKVGYMANIITNGLSLKPDIFAELVKDHFVRTYQITVDGTKENHDTRRITKSGEKTFDIIYNNIRDCVNHPYYKEYHCGIAVRCNIDRSNYESILPFIQQVYADGIGDHVKFQFAPIVDWGEVKGSQNSLSNDEFASIEIDWIMELVKRKGDIEIIPGRAYAPCMVVEPNSEVYDAFGNIMPCYEFSYTDMYQTDRHIIGNLKNAEETYSNDVVTRGWFQDVKDGKSWCKTCKYFPVCGGGCPKSWLYGTPACPSFKFNMEDRLVLQYIMESDKLAEVI
ncbi:MAG TPA: radical SAM protein [Puia sp.]|jgi:uncharacterized protein|nr:radical SAM protein [Puia sp.]